MISTKTAQGFSLIELLVALAIVALLAALLSPAIASVIERGRSAKCVNNLRQIGIAVQNSIADNDYRYPVIETEPPSLPPEYAGQSGTALEVLEPYGINRETLICPTDASTLRNFAIHGTSYHFSPVIQDEIPVNVNIYGRRGIFQIKKISRLTVCSDYGPVHQTSGRLGLNFLKAGGRVIQR